MNTCLLARLFVKVPRPEDNERTFLVFESSYDLSNHSKVEASR